MRADAARERALKSADFKTEFNASAVKQPLGPEPVLPMTIDLRPAQGQQGGFRRQAGRAAAQPQRPAHCRR
jgi:hypothetical protein